jgi:hypothetical protein
MISDVLLKSDSVVVNIDFEFKLIIIREHRLEFVPTDMIVFEGSNQSISIDGIVS